MCIVAPNEGVDTTTAFLNCRCRHSVNKAELPVKEECVLPQEDSLYVDKLWIRVRRRLFCRTLVGPLVVARHRFLLESILTLEPRIIRLCQRDCTYSNSIMCIAGGTHCKLLKYYY